MTKFAVDTNLYIRALRNPEQAAELERFLTEQGPQSYLLSVVLHEILVGATTPERERAIEDNIAAPFLRRSRVVTPSHRNWRDAGAAVARLAGLNLLDRSSLSRSFANDALIAVSCREAGVTLVTDNIRDFDRLRAVIPFDFVAPWP